MLEIKINESEGSAKIVVVGVGGAGNNAVNLMSGESYSHETTATIIARAARAANTFFIKKNGFCGLRQLIKTNILFPK